MNLVQPPVRYPVIDRPAGVPARHQLPASDDPMLSSGERGDHSVICMTFFIYAMKKVMQFVHAATMPGSGTREGTPV
jgi:hypothetical protein